MSAGGTEARQRVLDEARQFKASWTGLGRVLSEVEAAGTWRDWGFDSFAKYCRQELRLRSETAAKLTRSYAFLAARRDPSPQGAEAPPLDVVDLLARAPAATQLPQEAYQSAVDEVLGGAAVSRGQLLRRMRRHDPQAFRAGGREAAGADEAPAAEVAATAAAPQPDPQALRKTLALAARLVELVETLSLGTLPGRHARAVVRELRDQVAAAESRGAA